ncbi:MAG: FtsX-like permease family protein [Sphingobacteriales bacterium]|nr:MAG: FtsX-like permease family protein [Sphingobacteriales bacterium]
MNNTGQIISTSITQSFQELRANKLRTFLSLLGITIGIFCIIAVLTVLDSMKDNIRKEMSSLGSDVLYVNRWPWMDEGGEYKWWEFWRRPSMGPTELNAVTKLPNVAFATLCYTSRDMTVKHQDQELSSVKGYAVTNNFDQIQNIEIENGRYLSSSELDGTSNSVVIGEEIYTELFPGGVSAIGKTIFFMGRQFNVIGVMKKVGQNMAGFDFDNGIIFSYNTAASLVDVSSLNSDPVLIIKAAEGKSLDEVKYEVEGVLRSTRKVKPGQSNDFAMNRLSQISERLDLVFGTINVIGSVIGAFSLIVGAFGIANIMFVTVKERTRVIGLKKAIGARKSSILMEFLVEAVALCLAGGIIGIITVLLLSLALTYGADFPVTLSLKNFTIGISISAIVGILAGFIPARSASRLDPVVAIRSN